MAAKETRMPTGQSGGTGADPAAGDGYGYTVKDVDLGARVKCTIEKLRKKGARKSD